MKYWHGGMYPADGQLAPQETMRAGVPSDGYVYITTDPGLAATYAATLPGSWLMQVEPLGPVEPDPESILGTSFRCRAAVVVRRYTLSRAERAERANAVRLFLRRGGIIPVRPNTGETL